MKPPPRKRTKPDRNLKPEPAATKPSPGKLAWRWHRAERRKLRDALKRLSRTAGGHGDIDYAFLRKYVSTRSIPEIHTVVESLKDKVMSWTNFKLRRTKWEEENARKPVEVWAHMAASVAGTLEESISTAFSQMLMVSSTEPSTLRNCDPPQVCRPSTDRPVGRTVSLRPVPHLPVQAVRPGTDTARSFLVPKTSAPTTGPAKTLLPPPQLVRVPNSQQPQPSTTAGTSPAANAASQFTDTSCQKGAAKLLGAPSTFFQPALQTATPVVRLVIPGSRSVIETAQQLPEQHPTINPITCTSKSISSSPRTHLPSSATSLTPGPHTAPPSVASSSSVTASCSSTHATNGRTSKNTTKDNPRQCGVKCIVDFERIYRYLSVIHKQNEECHLTPMESAIVLDLLMSLPEELPLLDCNKLRKHLIEVFQCLSSPADSKAARESVKDLTGGLCALPEAERGSTAKGQQAGVGTADSPGVMHSGGKKLQPNEAESQSSGNENTSSQSRDTDVVGRCPPLNPFMVPLKLLARRQVEVRNVQNKCGMTL